MPSRSDRGACPHWGGAVIAALGVRLTEPGYLALALLIVPAAWLGLRSMKALDGFRRGLAIVLRSLLIAVLAVLLARPVITAWSEGVVVLAVVDRSASVPDAERLAALDGLRTAFEDIDPRSAAGVIDVAAQARIARLPTARPEVPQRRRDLADEATNLQAGVELAMAIAPPGRAVRIVLLSDGCETAGDLRAAAVTAAGSGIPIDVQPIRYRHDREVAVRRLVAPTRASSGQTIALRAVLRSTHATSGQLVLKSDGRVLTTLPMTLKRGTNVASVSLSAGLGGVQRFEAEFVAADASADRLAQNNFAEAVTLVSGPGRIVLVDGGRRGRGRLSSPAGAALMTALRRSQVAVQRVPASDFPLELAEMVQAQAIVLVNTDNSLFTYAQQQLMKRYVEETGGGLIMVGGPNAFGAGGWIGSPVADVMPVEMDPPQKKVMPKGALVVVIDRSGSMHGLKLQLARKAASEAVRLLSRRDLAGVIAFDDGYQWISPLAELSDKQAVRDRIRKLGSGGGTDIYPALEAAHKALEKVAVGVKHIILLTDGQTAGQDPLPLARSFAAGRVSVTTVAVGADSAEGLLQQIAKVTGGRHYPVVDPSYLPQIFVKEAQVIRRSLISEEPFTPHLADTTSEVIRGLTGGLPPLAGRVRTAPRPGLIQTVLATEDGEPVLATGQFELGRSLAFTSSAGPRWAEAWLAWGGFDRFWEQAVRWVAKSPVSTDCEIYADVDGREVSVNVVATDPNGRPVDFANLRGQIIAPDAQATLSPLALKQVGPGEYSGRFTGGRPGTYLLSLRYRPLGADRDQTVQAAVTVPFAPEYEALADNAALLTEVAAISGGRVLEGDPAAARLFDSTGLAQARAARPLTNELLIAFCALLLLDVAVRRIAVNYAAIGRRAFGWVGRLGRAGAQRGGTLDALAARKQKLRETLYTSPPATPAANRYVPPADADTDAPLPGPAEGDASPAGKASKPQAHTQPGGGAEPPERKPQPASHVDRLLERKRRARGGGAG